MNKLLVLISLFVSSFFLFSFSEKIKAEEVVVDYDFDINEYITEEFLTVRDIVLNYLSTSDYSNYFIRYQYDGDNLYPYIIYLFNSAKLYTSDTSSVFYFTVDYSVYKIRRLNNEIYNSSSSSTLILPSSTFKVYLDGNVNFYSNNKTFKVNYNDLTYLVDNKNPIPFLYTIYKDINNVPEDNPHQEELNVLSNFYNTVIDKLEYISEVFVSNYIYLSILVIFLLIFVFELIFRRFLW